jgi:hypothetical protein
VAAQVRWLHADVSWASNVFAIFPRKQDQATFKEMFPTNAWTWILRVRF